MIGILLLGRSSSEQITENHLFSRPSRLSHNPMYLSQIENVFHSYL